MKRQLFLDQDNFLADFSGGFKARFGVSEASMPKDEMWELIFSVPDFFLALEFVKGADDFFWSVAHKKPIILTKVPVRPHTSVGCVTKFVCSQKREWIRRKLGTTTMMIPVPAVVPKSAFMFNRGDILMDDYGVNCDEWREAGGVAIKHEHWGLTSQRLFEEFMR